MSKPLPCFTLGHQLVGQIFQLLSELPARHSRTVLNELERQCGEQQQAADQAQPVPAREEPAP